jgi:pyruvate,water dikinase
MDPSEKTIAELPELVTGLIRDQLERSYDPTAEAEAHRERREAALARARATLASRAQPVRTVFEALVVGAQRAYPIREDNQFFLVSAPIALLRYTLLEVGYRLGLREQIDRAEDVFFLELEELRAALQTGQDRTALVERRKGELAWVKAHPGPGCYGERPARPPSLDGLPEATRRLLEFLSWVFDRAEAQLESARRQSGDALQLTGVAGSAGRYRGPACVIRNETEFRKIRAGDVLVCPTTSPVWSVIFPSVGALVTDTGGILAHAALIAREYRVPAVLATGNATEILHDGQVETVDGTAGIVSIDI